MTTNSYNVDNILKQYTKQILPEEDASSSEPETAKKTKATADTVSISNEGKQRIRERFQSDVVDYLRKKY